MNDKIQTAFQEELEKIGRKTYPISRGITQEESSRRYGIEAMLGRIRKGGKGLARFEKGHLANMLKTTPAELEKALKRIGKRSKGMGTFPGARSLDWSPIPKISPTRQVSMRGFAGRHKVKEPHIAVERAVLDTLRKALKGGRLRGRFGR